MRGSECLRLRAAGRPVEQLDGMEDRNAEAGLELLDAADIARGHGGSTGRADVGDLALAQGLGELRLEDVVGSCRSAAEMSLGNLGHLETRGLEQRLGLAMEP